MTTKQRHHKRHTSMAENQSAKVPWVLPLKRPNYQFPQLKVSLKAPPTWMYGSFIFGMIFYVFSGLVYVSVQDYVQSYITDSAGRIQLIYTTGDCSSSTSRQYLLEGIVAGIMMFLGAFGLFSMYYASKDPHNLERTNNYQGLGAMAIFFAFLIIQNMMKVKGC